MENKNIHFSLDEAREELKKRWNDEDVMNENKFTQYLF